MKCIKHPLTGEIRRVTEREAAAFVEHGWRYASKAEWKASLKRKQAQVERAIPPIVPSLKPLRRPK